MTVRKLLILITILVCLTQTAQAIPFFTMNTAQGASPNAGWPTNVPESATHTKTFMPGAGPNGQNAYLFSQRYTGNSMPGYGGEFYWGWNGNIESSDSPQGCK